MPAKSKAQQRYMAIAEHNPTALYGPKPDMTRQQFHDFAATRTTGLPTHVKAAKPAPASQPARASAPAGSASRAAALASHPHAARLGRFLHGKKAR